MKVMLMAVVTDYGNTGDGADGGCGGDGVDRGGGGGDGDHGGGGGGVDCDMVGGRWVQAGFIRECANCVADRV